MEQKLPLNFSNIIFVFKGSEKAEYVASASIW